jgi:hypothetical protein
MCLLVTTSIILPIVKEKNYKKYHQLKGSKPLIHFFLVKEGAALAPK